MMRPFDAVINARFLKTPDGKYTRVKGRISNFSQQLLHSIEKPQFFHNLSDSEAEESTPIITYIRITLELLDTVCSPAAELDYIVPLGSRRFLADPLLESFTRTHYNRFREKADISFIVKEIHTSREAAAAHLMQERMENA